MTFFSADDNLNYLEEFGTPISWVDPSGSLHGTPDAPAYAVIDYPGRIERDSQGGFVSLLPITMRLMTDDALQMRNTTEITADGKIWAPITETQLLTDDGDLTVMQIALKRST